MTDLLLINVNKSAGVRPTIYDATRYAWKLDPRRAETATYVLAEYHGTVIGVFVAEEWLPTTLENFPTLENYPDLAPREAYEGRFGFRGREAPPDILVRYLGRRLDERQRGEQNPVRYLREEEYI
jgi:hypothetical protein